MRKTDKSIVLHKEDFEIFETKRKEYAARKGLGDIAWVNFFHHLVGNEPQVITGDEPRVITDPPAAVVTLAQLSAIAEKPVDAPADPGVEEVKESETVCTECDKKQSEIVALQKRLEALESEQAEKTETIPEDLNTVITHCQDGSCPAHAAQWEKIKQQIVDVNKADIIAATLNSLPDAVIEQEGLKRGYIPRTITIPQGRR